MSPGLSDLEEFGDDLTAEQLHELTHCPPATPTTSRGPGSPQSSNDQRTRAATVHPAHPLGMKISHRRVENDERDAASGGSTTQSEGVSRPRRQGDLDAVRCAGSATGAGHPSGTVQDCPGRQHHDGIRFDPPGLVDDQCVIPCPNRGATAV